MPTTSVTTYVEKIVVNSGIGRLSSQAGFADKLLPELVREFALITGQKPATRPARASIAGFKVRQGSVVGLTATLRGRRMADFLAKLTAIVLPRIRDFRGIPLSSVDGAGNLSIGIRDYLVFPETAPESSKVNFGVQVTVVPKRPGDRAEAIARYREMGIPLQKK